MKMNYSVPPRQCKTAMQEAMIAFTKSLGKAYDEAYLQVFKEFKKELWWIKSLALLPIESKVKDILAWKKELPEKFTEAEEFGWWKDIINFITPETANKIFDFMKEKRIAIEQRKTESN